MKDIRDEMSQFTSRRTAKVVRAEPKQGEWQEQLAFCKWLKHTYPNILFRSDIQSAGKLSPQMQNIKQIIDPYSGWPDVTIYWHTETCVGLMIEMKRIGASLSGDHWKGQSAMHELLRAQGWKVVVCFGAEEAKRVFLEYLGNDTAKDWPSIKPDEFDKNYLPF